ncbi:MAG: APC family permease [Geodermatophilaceae bacterium]|nr:APC family permease [Geodermatophilaceae bacterium]MDQ3455867.1 APC family permease [Actinomycetota bacterium]
MSSEFAPPTQQDRGLADRSMGQVAVLAQSVAAIAPSAVMASLPALIVLYAGEGAWVSYVAAVIVVVLIGCCVALFGRRLASSGSLYTYVARGLGPAGGFAAGWGIVIGYICIAMLGVIGGGVYLGSFLTEIGIAGASTTTQVILYVVFAVVAAGLAIAGIKLSTRLGLVLEVISVSAVLIVFIVVVVQNGLSLDTSQLRLEGATFDGVTFGIVLAVLGFVGFESAASLGAEAKNPHRAIPRAVLGSAVLVGLMYIFATYASVLGFGSAEALSQSAAPVSDLATGVGMDAFTPVIDLGVTASFFAVAIASINAASRVLYTMGEEGVLPAAVGQAHATYRTPHVAIMLITPFVALVPIVMVLNGSAPLVAFGYIGTVGTFGYMLAYLLMAASLPVFLRRRGESSPMALILSVVVVLSLLYVFYKNVYPVPPAPLNRMPYIFAAVLLVGLAWYLIVRVTHPERTRRVGTYEEEPVP